MKSELLKAVKLAQNNDWNAAHRVVQEYNSATACWIHAVLHKIEGDESNSRYWYARCNTHYEDFPDFNDELNAIIEFLS